MRSFVVAVVVGLVVTGAASAEVVARGVSDGQLAVSADGRPYVAYALGRNLTIAARIGPDRWRPQIAARMEKGSSLAAFATGPAGPRSEERRVGREGVC